MKNKKGISLIVLIITIIVVIILAAVVVLTLSKNNPIESAKESRFKEDIRTFQDELALYISKQYANAGGQWDGSISATNYDEIINYIPSFTKKYEGKFIINNNNLEYTSKLDDKEKEYAESINVKGKILPIEYQQVEYIESTGTQYIKTNIKFKFGYTAITSVNFPENIFISTMYVSGADTNYYSNFSMAICAQQVLNTVTFRAIYGTDIEYPNTNRITSLNSYSLPGYTLHSGTYVLTSSPNKIQANELAFSYNGNDNFTDTNLYVFNTNRNGSPMGVANAFKGRMNYYYIKNNDESFIIRLIPCYSTETVKNADGIICPSGTIGMYDTVEGKFYTNQGTGKFKAGPEV